MADPTLWRGHTMAEIMANEDLYREWIEDRADALQDRENDRRDHHNCDRG